MRGHVPYRIERDRSVDNADQRISEDIRLFRESALMLGLSFLGMLANLVIFGRLLSAEELGCHHARTGPLGTLTIPGYLLFVAIGWSLVLTAITHLAGHKIAGITVAQQKAEADFRFALARSRSCGAHLSRKTAQFAGNGRAASRRR